MDNIKKLRAGNFSLQKRPRKFNSWVANRPFEENQTNMRFSDDLGQLEKWAHTKQ